MTKEIDRLAQQYVDEGFIAQEIYFLLSAEGWTFEAIKEALRTTRWFSKEQLEAL